ncbi:hypothetical protein EV191_10527 [Tamaricihabitans halophyticus]|uniref:Methyltransferase family protein n=1 Tax=Tamaricihabitans halophyticus TaxID=1262583 RepID=A0A4V6NRC4_9PSEU|nr:class I SAM-dependent methyltransferase [Tamaricihabitans halophyticus]TCP52966.1 hypothetical protein EV191_10527 [Tamaricihabitans halophyticus]
MARTPRLAAGRARALGLPTRGTTNPNRLRRVDRWLTGNRTVLAALRAEPSPLVVDLGYGSSPVTTVELADRLGKIQPAARFLGLELDAERVAAAKSSARPPWLDFRRGGFELAGARPMLLRAFNVLRQYSEEDGARAWATMRDRLAPGGLLVEGTCDELGRRCAWVLLDQSGPKEFTISCRPDDLDQPSDVAERLPKCLIHRNTPGERVHELLSALDTCWAHAANQLPYGPRARWVEAVRLLAERGWPVLGDRRRWRLGELTVSWSSVAP